MSGEPSPPRMRTRSSVRRSFRVQPGQVVVDNEIILTPARSSRRSSRRTRSVAPVTPPRAARRRSKARRETLEGESEAEEETQEDQVEGEAEAEVELEQVVELAVQQEEEEAEADVEEEEEEEMESTEEESAIEEKADGGAGAEEEEEGEEDTVVVLQAQTPSRPSPAVTLTPVTVMTPSNRRKEERGDHTMVVILLAFCTFALLCTSGLVLFRVATAPAPAISLPEAHWTEDDIAFLTDQRILASVRAEIAAVDSQLRQKLLAMTSAQHDATQEKMAAEVKSMLGSIAQIRKQVGDYEAASVAAREALKASMEGDNVPSAAMTQLKATQDQMKKQLKQLAASLELKDGSEPIVSESALLALGKSVETLDKRVSALHHMSSEVSTLREEALQKIAERMKAHDDLVARYTRDMDSLLEMLDETKATAATTAMATKTLAGALEDLSVPQMAEIESRVRTIVDAELAKQPALKQPGLGRDHVTELINAAIAKDSANRFTPLTEAEVEAAIAAQVLEVAGDVADLKHRMAAKPVKTTLDTSAAISAEMSAEMVEAERSRIMSWVTHAIEKARLAPTAPQGTPVPAIKTPVAAVPLHLPGEVDIERIRASVMKDVYRLVFADSVGKADYALASGGAHVIDYSGKWSVKRMLGWLSPFPAPSASVEEVISKETALGSCWALAGKAGFVTVQLAKRVLVDSFSLDHVASAVAHNRESAPRDFRVWGYTARGSKAIFMGDFTYDINGEQVQTFTVTEGNDTAVSIVKLEVLSNHGHEDYTCIYRFRVHGSLIELAL